MSTDFGRVGLLLHIVDKAKNWPALRDLHDEAMRELVAMDVDCALAWIEEQDKIAAEKAKVDAEKARIAKDNVDKQRAGPAMVPTIQGSYDPNEVDRRL